MGDWMTRLEAEARELAQSDDLGAADRTTVTLDQQSVGRLSRMDALQRQAIANATARRRAARKAQLAAALARLDQGEFGYCTECGDEIDEARLKLDPAVARCLSCARG